MNDKLIELKNRLLTRFLNENDELKAENKELMILKDDKKRLNHELRNKLADAKAEIKSLKDKLQAVNDDYNNDMKKNNKYEDGLLAEIETLKAENKRLYQEHRECRSESN